MIQIFLVKRGGKPKNDIDEKMHQHTTIIFFQLYPFVLSKPENGLIIAIYFRHPAG